MKPFDVLTLGALTYDAFVYSEAFRVRGQELSLPLGGKLLARDIVFSTGGGAANAAVTFANLGFRVGVQGNVGDDDQGSVITRRLFHFGVQTGFLRHVRKERTALSIILSTPSHERTVIVRRGASALLSDQNLVWPKVKTRWLYVTSLGGNMRLLSHLTQRVTTAGTPFCMNPGEGELRHRKQLFACLRHASIVLLNREEANELLGARNATPLVALKKLSALLPGIIVITDGPAGAWCRVGRQGFRAGTHRHLRVKERTGAGDAFGSGFLAGLLRSKGDVRIALQAATLNSEAVMKEIGAQNALLRSMPKSSAFVPIHRLPTVFPLPSVSGLR